METSFFSRTLTATQTTLIQKQKQKSKKTQTIIRMRDRSKNRKQLQRGRNLSTEAIQTVQSLKRAASKTNNQHSLNQLFDSKFKRLLKLDMLAVLKELLRQNQCDLALKVFEDIRKEYWYKPQVSLYAEMISVYASNGLFGYVNLLHSLLKTEANLKPELEGFNALMKILLDFHITDLVIESYGLMKKVGCEPDRTTFRLLINGFESIGETEFSGVVREDAQEIYGSVDFLQEEDEMVPSETNY